MIGVDFKLSMDTHRECVYTMGHFIKVIGNIDFQCITLKHGELFRQSCLDKFGQDKRRFSLARVMAKLAGTSEVSIMISLFTEILPLANLLKSV